MHHEDSNQQPIRIAPSDPTMKNKTILFINLYRYIS